MSTGQSPAISRVLVEEVIGLAGGRTGQEIGRGRGHDDQFGLVAEPDVVDRVDGVEHAVAHRVPDRASHVATPTKRVRRLGGDDRDVMPGFSRSRRSDAHLVGGNPSPDSED